MVSPFVREKTLMPVLPLSRQERVIILPISLFTLFIGSVSAKEGREIEKSDNITTIVLIMEFFIILEATLAIPGLLQ